MCQGSFSWIPSKTQRHSMFRTISFILQETWSIIFPLAPLLCIWCRVRCSNFRLSASQRGRSCTGRSTKRPEGVAATWSDSTARTSWESLQYRYTVSKLLWWKKLAWCFFHCQGFPFLGSKWRPFWISKSSALEFLFRSLSDRKLWGSARVLALGFSTRHLPCSPLIIVTVVHTNTLSWFCLLGSALCCQRDLRLTYSIPLTCRSTCTCQHEACLTSSRKQLWSHLSIIYVSCFTMFHPHSEGPRSVLRIFQNSPGWKQDLCWTDLRKSILVLTV